MLPSRLPRHPACVLLALCSCFIFACSDGVSPDQSGNPANAAKIAAGGVKVRLENATISLNQTTQATATDGNGNPLKGKVTWASSNSGVASVANNGQVKALGPGSATIRATFGPSNGEALLSVQVPASATVAVSLGSSSLIAGQSTQATAVATDGTGATITTPVTWSSLNPSVATVSSTGTVTGVAAGSTTIRATVNAVNGDAPVTITVGTTSVNPTPVVPTTLLPPAPSTMELPRVYLNTSLASTPSTGRMLRVALGGSLQRALDTAVAGDRILLAAGATFTGNFILSAKTSGGNPGEWITVQSDGALPAEGTRVSPAMAASMQFPKLVSATLNSTLATNPAAARWRFIGLEFTVDPTLSSNQGVIVLGDGSSAQNTLASTPTDLVLDRVYIHGQPLVDLRKCVAFNSARTAVIDSYVSECHSAFDAQAVAGTNGPGPFKIVNNYLEASGETVMWGGADPGIPNLVPSDIEIRRNYFYRPMTWRGKWLEKAIIESKNSSHVLVEANVMENSWVDGQYGWVVALWSVNQQGGCTWCITEHWTVRNNLIRNVSAGFSLTSKYSTPSPKAHHIAITNNVIIGMDNPAIQGYGRIFSIYDVPDLTIEHNTAFTPYNPSFSYSAGLMPNHVVRNNLVGGGTYQIFSSAGMGQPTWDAVAGTGSSFAGNVVALYPDWLNAIANNLYPATLDAVGLVGGGAAAYSVTASPMDLTLGAASPYKGKATDGTDPGADMALVLSATAGVKP